MCKRLKNIYKGMSEKKYSKFEWKKELQRTFL